MSFKKKKSPCLLCVSKCRNLICLFLDNWQNWYSCKYGNISFIFNQRWAGNSAFTKLQIHRQVCNSAVVALKPAWSLNNVIKILLAGFSADWANNAVPGQEAQLFLLQHCTVGNTLYFVCRVPSGVCFLCLSLKSSGITTEDLRTCC